MKNAPDVGFKRELDAEIEKGVQDIEQLLAEEAEAQGELLEAEPASTTLSETTPAGESVDRRDFLRGSAAVASSIAIAGTLQMFHARKAHASQPRHYYTRCPYGDPIPTADEVTGLPLIGLPPGFRYWSFGWTGDPIFPNLSNGPITPALHDGMAVLRQIGPLAIICRNHEVANAPAFVDGSLRYSPGGGGGNTNIIFDTWRKRWVAAWPTLSGTVRNCAGGATEHQSWLSCEETTGVTQGPDGKAYQHGWVFDVPAIGVSDAKPIKSMGLRSHEACAVDPYTGVVYLTEDATPGGLFRFTPHRTRRWESPYANGGKLEMLKVVGSGNTPANLRGAFHGTPYPVELGEPLDIEWVPINDPENLNGVSNWDQGGAQGGADFRRPEGAWYGRGKIYFVATDGGTTANGQVFVLDIRKQTLSLIYDAPVDANGQPSELDNPDNLTVTPRGGLLFCEDNAGSPNYTLNGINTERLVGLTRNGEIFTFANNLVDFRPTSEGGLGSYTRPSGVTFTGNQRGNEWAGATFDRTGEWLFVCIQTPGVTFAITGPWHHGPL
jgi:secreted PhoX family phosphatase